MERPTKVIETPIDKHKVEIRTYASGGEMEEIKDVLIGDMEVEVPVAGLSLKEDIKPPKMKISKMREATHKTFELLVVSINGSKENIVKNICDMRREDYQFIADEFDRMAEFTQKKIVKKK